MESLIEELPMIYLLTIIACVDTTPPASPARARAQTISHECSEGLYNYTTVGQPFMLTWCTSCHHSDLQIEDRQGAPPSVNLENYTDVIAQLARIEARVLTDPITMPPAGGPTSKELDRLAIWIACGASQ